MEKCGVQTLSQNRFFLISSSRPAERHAVDTVGVDLFVIYRGRLCDLPPMSGTASMAELASETLKC